MDDATRGMVGLFVMCALFIIKANSSGKEPTFTHLNINCITNLLENAPPRSTVYTLLATDIEADNLTYGKVSQLPSQPDFQLNTKTGELYSPRGIDADCKNSLSQFVFKFDVSDGTSTVQSANLTVNITDVNDNYPAFSSSQFNISVLNTAVSGEIVIEVTATDADITSVLSYFIIDGSPSHKAVFNISNKGQIFLNRNLAYLNHTRDFSLTVQASDGTFSNTTQVYIKVIQNLCHQTNPCQNNDTCRMNISSGNFTCHCSLEWTGENCSKETTTTTTTTATTITIATDFNTTQTSGNSRSLWIIRIAVPIGVGGIVIVGIVVVVVLKKRKTKKMMYRTSQAYCCNRRWPETAANDDKKAWRSPEVSPLFHCCNA